jgi:DNA-binding MarR family transcriptional regulator
MNNSKPIPLEQNLQLLVAVGQNPRVTQADLAAQLGVAVGTVNWYLRRMIAQGCIKVRRMERKRLLYLLTPRGLSEKSRLGLRYVRTSLRTYRETRRRALSLVARVRRAGYDSIVLQGDGDLAEICRLTCLDQRILIARPSRKQAFPILKVDGANIDLWMPKGNGLSKHPARDSSANAFPYYPALHKSE